MSQNSPKNQFSQELSLSIDRNALSPVQNLNNSEIAKLMKTQHDELISNFSAIKTELSTVKTQMSGFQDFKVQATTAIKELISAKDQMYIRVDKLEKLDEVNSIEVQKHAEQLEYINKVLKDLQEGRGGPRPTGNLNDRKEGQPISLFNIPLDVDPAQVLNELGFRPMIDQESVMEVFLKGRQQLVIVCRTGAAKYKIASFIKSNLPVLQNRQISLSEGFSKWVMSEKVVNFQDYRAANTKTWTLDIANFKSANFQ